MSIKSDKTISILTSDINDTTNQEQRSSEAFFPKLPRFAVKSSQLAITDLSEELSSTIRNLNATLDKIDDIESKYQLDEIRFSLSIDASGKVSLIGEISTGVQTGVEIILKRR